MLNNYSNAKYGFFIFFLLVGFMAMRASAVELPTETVLPLSLAVQAAQTAVDKCVTDGYRVSAAVVDRGGNIRALLRADGAGAHTVDSSRKKAYTAASLKRPTDDIAKLVVKTPELQGLHHISENMIILAGGLPIEFDGQVVGGIGVGGAPGGHLDAACAQAGLTSIGAANKLEKK